MKDLLIILFSAILRPGNSCYKEQGENNKEQFFHLLPQINLLMMSCLDSYLINTVRRLVFILARKQFSN